MPTTSEEPAVQEVEREALKHVAIFFNDRNPNLSSLVPELKELAYGDVAVVPGNKVLAFYISGDISEQEAWDQSKIIFGDTIWW